MLKKMIILLGILLMNVTVFADMEWKEGNWSISGGFINSNTIEQPLNPRERSTTLLKSDYDYDELGVDIGFDYQRITNKNFGFNLGLSYGTQKVGRGLNKPFDYILLNSRFVYELNDEMDFHLGVNYPLSYLKLS